MKDINRYTSVYPIGVVKNLTGLSKRQIRYYEETELVIPERTSGNQRLFSLADVEKLLRIKKLLERGMNIEEVKQHLARRETQDPERDTLSHLKKLARRSDISANFRQDIEALSRQRPEDETEVENEPPPSDRPPSKLPRNLRSLYPVRNRSALIGVLEENRNKEEEQEHQNRDEE